MTVAKHEKENLIASTEAENNKANTLTALYQKQREIKQEVAQRSAAEKQERYAEIEADARKEWEEVQNKAHEMLHHSHGYGAGWSRLYDFAWALRTAMLKDAPMRRGKNMDALMDYMDYVVTPVSCVTGGLIGGLVGGVGGLFGVGDGLVAGAQNGVRFAMGESNNQVQYFVDVNKEGTLDYWLKRSDGKDVTKEEKLGYMADVQCWLQGQGYVPGAEPWTYEHAVTKAALTKADFGILRENAETGLASYFNSKIEAKSQLAPELSEIWQSASMGL